MTVVSMCQISSAPVMRSPTFGVAGHTEPWTSPAVLRDKAVQVEEDADTVPSRCARTASLLESAGVARETALVYVRLILTTAL